MTQTVAGSNHDVAHFSRIPTVEIPRSVFNRSHGLKATLDSGLLRPILVDEMLPGDTINCSVNSFARMATPLHPIMDNQYMEFFFFAVPLRIIWDNFQKFMGEQDDPGDSTDFLVPQVDVTAVTSTVGSLADSFGLPLAKVYSVSALPFRAYNLIYNEWFRSQDLEDSIPNNRGDTNDAGTDYGMRRRGKRHDYFTSCLPFPAKTDTPVLLPLGTTAPVVGLASTDITFELDGPTLQLGATGSAVSADYGGAPGGTGFHAARWVATALEADLTNATAATINQLREAFQLQRLYERDARGGTRYTEIIRSHFGVLSPDSRLQRPEYIGGGQVNINVNPIANTSGTSGALGDLSAYVTGAGRSRGFLYSATEHCIVIGLVSIRADLNYQNNINRMWTRKTRFDYFWPVFSHIGEQAVLSKEIFFDEDPPNDDSVFGYQEAWAEYRHFPSIITGEFRSDFAQSLDTWHLAQDFITRPLLNSTFIRDDPPISRVIATPADPEWLLDLWFNYAHTRPMPTYSVPGLIDHF